MYPQRTSDHADHCNSFLQPVILTRSGKDDDIMIFTMVMLGVSLAFGSLLSGLLTTRAGPRCTISRQYLYQMASCGCGMMMTLFTIVDGFYATLLFVCVYGLLCGGLQYSLKVYILEVVGRQLADGAWGVVAMAQAVPTLMGAPIVGRLRTCSTTEACQNSEKLPS